MMNSLSLEEQSEICFKCEGWCCSHTGKVLTRNEETFMAFQGHKIHYKLDGTPYIFLKNECQYFKDNKCIIYDKERHWVCKLFPGEYHEVFIKHCELMRRTCEKPKNGFRTLK